MNRDMAIDVIAWARARVGARFRWGSANCVALAMDWSDTLTGGGLLARYAHMQRTARRAWWASRHYRLTGLARIFAEAGWLEVPVWSAQPGDIGLGVTPDGELSAQVNLGPLWLSSTPGEGVIARQLPAIALARIAAMLRWEEACR